MQNSVYFRIQNILASTIATVGPCGHLPRAPGTWGSLAALLAAPWLFLPLEPLARVLVVLLILVVGVWASSRAEQVLGRADPGCVVVDEWCGQWMTLLPFAALSPGELLAGFVFFRLADIIKPWPIRWVDQKVKGGLGIMLDDCLAAIPAAAALWAVVSLGVLSRLN